MVGEKRAASRCRSPVADGQKLWFAITVGALAALGVESSLAMAAPPAPQLFDTSKRCQSCHNGLVDSRGADVSMGLTWQGSMMANAARDPYWQAAVRREVTDHPMHRAAIEQECSTCHMPMAHYQSLAEGRPAMVFSELPAASRAASTLATDGVSCTVCHQIRPENLGKRESFVGRFKVDGRSEPGQRRIFGPFEVDAGRERVMASSSGFIPSRGDHIRSSELCATCHTLITQAFGPTGEKVGELPEQVPYLEWLHSSYRTRRGCSDCHMPKVEGPVAISSVLPLARPKLAQHAFRGGNAFMMRLLNRYSRELGVLASPSVLTRAAEGTAAHLESSSAELLLAIEAGANSTLHARVTVRSGAGHKLPTAYPSRRVWLHLQVVDSQGQIVFESGASEGNGAIRGNDNDLDAKRFEPHYDRIESEDQVQIYEAIIAGPSGDPTTGLLTATRYVKDNRLLPLGFLKKTARAEIQVHGAARADSDFIAGGDEVHYQLPLPEGEGSFTVRVSLNYQSIGFRWAESVARYPEFEPQRFARMYRSSAASGVQTLATRSARFSTTK